ncbi:hypothetical protein AVEN_74685-1 [Araneus ventricosus]|uniref:Uncharacterized protein n=1 Tax=Araneus ventricosus TaxID=182803 RepID=A0A4Y2S3H8_ARAVE|nr:hypothetical protein AVEN_74685-1 [Araneus ventricosus]
MAGCHSASFPHYTGLTPKSNVSSSNSRPPGGGETQKTTLSPYNATREKNSNNTQDYGMDYYEYPVGLFLTYNDTYGLGAYNETYNDTYGLGAYYNGYYGDYYGLYAYPELGAYYDEMVDNSTKNVIPTLMTTKKHEKGTKKSKTRRSKRKTRSIPEESNIKHLCIRNLLNVTNIFDKYIRYIFECKDKESKHFACIDSSGFIKPCYLLKDRKKPEVSLCIKKENASYVMTCNSPEPRSFCFTEPRETKRILICNDQKRRVCFNGGLTICNNQEKKRVPREIVKPSKDIKRPDVNCSNCEVEVKMLVDEMVDNSPPKVQIKVSKLDPLEMMMDAVDLDFDK